MQALVLALRDIDIGEEIYASYGQGYWRKRGGFPLAVPTAERRALGVASCSVCVRWIGVAVALLVMFKLYRRRASTAAR